MLNKALAKIPRDQISHFSTTSVPVKPRTAIAKNIIVSLGICAKN
jgi:hypothetical protein